MKLVETVRPGIKPNGNHTRVAFLPTGNLLIVEENSGDEGIKLKLYVAGTSLAVRGTYEQLVENCNAQLENWRA